MKKNLWCLSSLVLLGWGVSTVIPNRTPVVFANPSTPEVSETSITPSTTPTVSPATLPSEPTIEVSPETKIQATHLILNLQERKVYAYQHSQLLKSFPVAIGKKGWETPKGSFKVLQLIENPQWQNPWNGKIHPPGPNSPLGERWIGFWTDGKNFIGFHGTPGEHLIGQAVSHGCVRMRNKDIKELFDLVPMGIPVTVK
jgi:lipoprotein-anchoring transpeptidase ErfK/SrfK